MIIILMFGMLGIVFGVSIVMKAFYLESFFEWIGALIFTVLMFFVGLTFGIGVVCLIPYSTTTTTKSYDIECIQDNSTTGSFFLGSGYIDGSMKYIYYIQNEDSSFEMKILDYDKVKLFYSDDEPKVVKEIVVGKDGKQSNGYSICTTCDDVVGKIKIYIPKGTIIQNYNLDAQ